MLPAIKIHLFTSLGLPVAFSCLRFIGHRFFLFFSSVIAMVLTCLSRLMLSSPLSSYFSLEFCPLFSHAARNGLVLVKDVQSFFRPRNHVPPDFSPSPPPFSDGFFDEGQEIESLDCVSTYGDHSHLSNIFPHIFPLDQGRPPLFLRLGFLQGYEGLDQSATCLFAVTYFFFRLNN